jgi:hypothetical protein
VLSQHFRNSRAPFKPHSVAASGSLGCELWQIFARALASEAHFSAAPVCFCAAIDGVLTNNIEHATATQRSLLIVHLASSICTLTACCRNLNPGAPLLFKLSVPPRGRNGVKRGSVLAATPRASSLTPGGDNYAFATTTITKEAPAKNGH